MEAILRDRREMQLELRSESGPLRRWGPDLRWRLVWGCPFFGGFYFFFKGLFRVFYVVFVFGFCFWIGLNGCFF